MIGPATILAAIVFGAVCAEIDYRAEPWPSRGLPWFCMAFAGAVGSAVVSIILPALMSAPIIPG